MFTCPKDKISINEFMNFCHSLRAKHTKLHLLQNATNITLPMGLIMATLMVSDKVNLFYTLLCYLIAASIVLAILIVLMRFCQRIEKKDFSLTHQKYVDDNFKKEFLSLWKLNSKFLEKETNQKIYTMAVSWDKGDLPDIKELYHTITVLQEKHNSVKQMQVDNYLQSIDANWL